MDARIGIGWGNEKTNRTKSYKGKEAVERHERPHLKETRHIEEVTCGIHRIASDNNIF